MKTIVILLVTIWAGVSFATVDSIGKGKIPFAPPHGEISDFPSLAKNWNEPWVSTQGYCMTDFMYYDYYSSSALPKYERLLKPFNIPTFPDEGKVEQINELADGVLKIETDWEKFEQYVQLHPDQGWASAIIQEPEFVIDVSGYDQSKEGGKLQAMVMAKLAIITLHYNLAQYGQLFRMKIEVKGLPADQSEFVRDNFSAVVAKTNWPYSGPSPVAQKFYKELINPEFCEAVSKEAKSFAK